MDERFCEMVNIDVNNVCTKLLKSDFHSMIN